MAKSGFSITFVSIVLFIISIVIIPTKCYHNDQYPSKEKAVVNLFIFGDSLFDAGNNNYINTTVQANYVPYGETFFGYPTGRFSDGRIFPDFIAEYAKLPYIPPYLQPRIHEYEYGVNFASAGAGALLQTRQGLVIDLKTQLGYFKNFSGQLKQKLGDAEAKALLSRAVYLFSVGNNDYSFLFETNSSVLSSDSPQQFVGLVIGNITQVIREIYNIGGRKFGFLSLGPLGCAPAGRVLEGSKSGACFERINQFIESHNRQLSKLLKRLQNELKGFKYSLVQLYTFAEQLINHPLKYDFKEGKVACCGSGPYRGISNCGGRRGPVKEYHLCKNVSEYVFFDSGHPTERVNEQLAKQAWTGKPSFSGPNNLKALFESK